MTNGGWVNSPHDTSSSASSDSSVDLSENGDRNDIDAVFFRWTYFLFRIVAMG